MKLWVAGRQAERWCKCWRRKFHTGPCRLTEAVRDTLQERAKARQEAAAEPHLLFVFDVVTKYIQVISSHKASLRFPRAVVQSNNPLGHKLCWLLLNLFMALGVVPTAWRREATFIRKRGPQIVTELKNLRPISYTDELQTLFDPAWLDKCRDLLEEYVGTERAGGRFDSTLVPIGILIALQTRRNWDLPTFCIKADLLQGYDLTCMELKFLLAVLLVGQRLVRCLIMHTTGHSSLLWGLKVPL